MSGDRRGKEGGHGARENSIGFTDDEQRKRDKAPPKRVKHLGQAIIQAKEGVDASPLHCHWQARRKECRGRDTIFQVVFGGDGLMIPMVTTGYEPKILKPAQEWMARHFRTAEYDIKVGSKSLSELSLWRSLF